MGRSRNDITAARARAFELAKYLQAGRPSAKPDIENDFVFYEGNARYVFADELSRQFGQRPREAESDASYEKGVCVAHTNGLWIITPQPKVTVEQGGTTYQFFAQAFKESSTSVSVEIYTQYQGGVEAGIGLEGKAGPVKFSLGLKGSVMKGRKDAEKEEDKSANRAGRTASRTYVAERVSHEVIFVIWNKAYQGLCEQSPQPMGMDPPTRIAKGYSYDQRSLYFAKELGFRVSQKEGGAAWEPYWPEYSPAGQPVENSAQKRVRELLDKMQFKLAEELASGFTP